MTVKTSTVDTAQSTLEPSPALLAVQTTGPLAMPIPDGCSDLYAAGWACADAYVVKDADIGAEAGANWGDARVNGFWDRLKAERERRESLATVSGN